MMLDAIDKYIAQEPDISDEQFRVQMNDSVRDVVRSIWEHGTPEEPSMSPFRQDMPLTNEEPA
jgi:hypothetical protein